jgi:hypothetical protein
MYQIFVFFVFFILYTPKLIFKPFIKNKFYNVLLCSLFFIVSVNLVDFLYTSFLNERNLETFQEGAFSNNTSQDCVDSQKYSGTDSDLVKKLKVSVSDITDIKADDKANILTELTDAKNKIVASGQEYSKKICANPPKAVWTTPPANYLTSYQDSINNKKKQMYDDKKNKKNVTEKPNVVTAKPNVVTAKPNVATAKSNVVTAKPNVATTKPNVATAKPNVVTAKPNVATAKPNVVTTKPNVVTAKPNVVTAKPNVVTAKPNVAKK